MKNGRASSLISKDIMFKMKWKSPREVKKATTKGLIKRKSLNGSFNRNQDWHLKPIYNKKFQLFDKDKIFRARSKNNKKKMRSDLPYLRRKIAHLNYLKRREKQVRRESKIIKLLELEDQSFSRKKSVSLPVKEKRSKNKEETANRHEFKPKVDEDKKMKNYNFFSFFTFDNRLKTEPDKKKEVLEKRRNFQFFKTIPNIEKKENDKTPVEKGMDPLMSITKVKIPKRRRKKCEDIKKRYQRKKEKISIALKMAIDPPLHARSMKSSPRKIKYVRFSDENAKMNLSKTRNFYCQKYKRKGRKVPERKTLWKSKTGLSKKKGIIREKKDSRSFEIQNSIIEEREESTLLDFLAMDRPDFQGMKDRLKLNVNEIDYGDSSYHSKLIERCDASPNKIRDSLNLESWDKM